MLKHFRFRSWIPTTTGHLSFRNVGQARPGIVSSSAVGEHPATTEEETAHIRLVCAQLRANRDGRWLIRSYYRMRAKYSKSNRIYHSYYVLVARTFASKTPYFPSGSLENGVSVRDDPRGELRGSIHVLSYGTNKAEYRKNRNIFISACEAILESNDESVKRGFSYYSSKMRRLKIGTIIDFRLFRTGEVWLDVRGNSNVRGSEDDEALAEARQAFLFLKDCAHIHHHHPIWDDQFIPVSKADSGDFIWRRQVLWDLVRSAGQLRRQKDWRRRNRALGILAYAQAFHQMLARIKWKDGVLCKFDQLATYSFENQKQSIDAAEKFDVRRTQSRISLIIASVAVGISILSMFVVSFLKQNYIFSFEFFVWLIFWAITCMLVTYDLYAAERSLWEALRRVGAANLFGLVRKLRVRTNVVKLAVSGFVLMVSGISLISIS
jgi:hypothetical protein